MNADAVIEASQLSKTFWIPAERRTRLKEHVLALRRPERRRLDALRGVDLRVERGRFLGVIGANGSGKSTLLRLIAGIYRPTSGRLQVRGSIAPYIELGIGFNPELTGRENVFLSGTIMGMRRSEVAALMPDIVAFAELDGFMEQKLKNFSSGMLARLGFSIALRPHAEILLVDEVLAVGDDAFKRKCFAVFRRLRAEGRTVVLVSHDLDAVEQFSDDVLVLDRGQVHGIFPPQVAIERYQHLTRDRAAPNAPAAREASPDSPRISSVGVIVGGARRQSLHRGDDVELLIMIENPRRRTVNVGVSILREDGTYCFGTNTLMQRTTPTSAPSIEARLRLPSIPLQAGVYSLVVGLFGETTEVVYEMRADAYRFTIAQDDHYEGLTYLPHDWTIRARDDA